MGLVGSPSTGADWQCPQRGIWEVKPCWLMGSVVQGGTQVARTEVRAWEGSRGKGKLITLVTRSREGHGGETTGQSHQGVQLTHLVPGLGCLQTEGAEKLQGCPAQSPQCFGPERAPLGLPSVL